jgi:hypothetical protein
MRGLVRIGSYDIPAVDHDRFKSGELAREWHNTYPALFDDDDFRLLEKQAARGNHYYEWRAAIILLEQFGYHSLIEKYQFKNHPRKQPIFLARVPPSVLDLIRRRKDFGNPQLPDLFVYKPDDPTDWFFCEVKGGPDSISDKQKAYFRALGIATGKTVRLIEFRPK